MTNFEYIKNHIDEKTLAMSIAIMVDGGNDAPNTVNEYLDWLRKDSIYSDGIIQEMGQTYCKE